MRPHNGWWKTSSTPRRWLDAVRAQDPGQADEAVTQVPVPAIKPQPAQANA